MSDIEQQIRAAIQNGLSKASIESLIGRDLTESERQFYVKEKAVWNLKEKKRRRDKKHERLSGRESKRRFDERKSSIDDILDEAVANINWTRRNLAQNSLTAFIKTYLMDVLFDQPPSEKMELAIREMFKCLTDSRPYNIELPRGSGKTSIAEAMVLYLLAYGLRKFCVIVSSNGRAAQTILKDLYRVISDKDTPFSQDFPDISVPFITCNGFTRRIQKYRGVIVDIEKRTDQIVLPRIIRDGKPVPTSGSVIVARGITAGLRGLKVGKQRPDVVLCDDIQTAETAASSDQVAKLLDLLKKDVMNLSSKGKLSVMMTSTPICPEDLCETIENDVNWKTTKFPAIIKYPTDMDRNPDDGLWSKYFRIYDRESMTDSPHEESLQFYRDNFDAMNEGAELFAPRYKESDGHISGLQALLERRHLIGIDAFEAEHQMKPKKISFSIDISPKVVLQRIGKYQHLEVPDGYTFLAASTDLNVSYACSTVVVAFKRDLTATVIHHRITPCKIDQKLNDTEYNQKVYAVLEKIAKHLQQLGLKLNAWGIDAGGRNFSTVCEFAKNCSQNFRIPACGMMGKASHLFNPLVRSRLRDAIGRVVLCGNQQEQTRAGSGHKYLFWDSDFYREVAQRSFLAPLGSQGGCQLFDGTTDQHTEFAQQFTNERLKFIKHRLDGREEYFWATKEPHDFLDAMGMAYGIAAFNGINGEVAKPVQSKSAHTRFYVQKSSHRKIRIV